MKRIYLFAIPFCVIGFCACNKEITSDEINANESNTQNGTQVLRAVKIPQLITTSTTQSQFIATDNGDGTAAVTLAFAAKKPGISIESFTFLAYETNSNDAFSITPPSNGVTPGFFKPTSSYDSAKAIASFNGTNISLPDDGSYLPVTFTIHYNSTSGGVTSGDAVSVKLYSIEYVDPQNPYILNEYLPSSFSPPMMLTGSKPLVEIDSDNIDGLHIGLTKIFTVTCSSAQGSIGINNLPLIIDTQNVSIKKDVIVKDENDETVDVTITHAKNHCTIRFPQSYILDGNNKHSFNVFANVTHIGNDASIKTFLQPPSKFSWTDLAGGKSIPYTLENAIYYYNYPQGFTVIR